VPGGGEQQLVRERRVRIDVDADNLRAVRFQRVGDRGGPLVAGA